MEKGSRDVKRNCPPSVGLVGFGICNRGVLSYLSAHGIRDVRVRSATPVGADPLLEGIPCLCGDGYLDGELEQTLVLTPTVRREDPRFTGHTLTSDAEIFFSGVSGEVIAVSGSDGKSTTAALTYDILRHAGHTDAVLAGNIGSSLSETLSDDQSGRLYAVELSSFQLQYMIPKTRRAALTSLSENHLNWHRDMKEYLDAKAHLLAGCEEPVLAYDDPLVRDLFGARKPFAAVSLGASEATLSSLGAAVTVTVRDGILYKNGRALTEKGGIRLSGKHNLTDLCLAVALTSGFADDDAVRKTAATFEGLPHRCRKVATIRGVGFFDSSIDTSPARTAMTLSSRGRPVIVLLGGRSKHLDPAPLVDVLRRKCRLAVLFGESAGELSLLLDGAGFPYRVTQTLPEAVGTAFQEAQAGDEVILSPAYTSFDLYRDFNERGDAFCEAVRAIAERFDIQNDDKM